MKAKNNDGECFLKFYQLRTEIWYPSLIQLLRKLNKENNDRQPLIDYLNVYYESNPKIREDVLQFERTYSPSTAINWYTRNSFIYSLLNKAFRAHDYEQLILFRFFIADLYEQSFRLYTDLLYQFFLHHSQSRTCFEGFGRCICVSSSNEYRSRRSVYHSIVLFPLQTIDIR